MKGRSLLETLPAWEANTPDHDPCIVFDEDDNVNNLRFALELNNPSRGLLVVDITPGTRRTYQMANDILTALGKRYDISGASQTSHETWFRACAWIVGERVRDIVVCRAHLLNGLRWERLIELAAIARARLWLVVHRPSLSRAQREAARDWGMRTMRFAEFRRRSRHAARERPSAQSPRRVDPDVPDEEFPIFLASSQRLLDPQAFNWLQGIYWSAHEQTLSWLDNPAAPLTEIGIAEFVYALLAPAPGLSEMIVRARAAQAAAFMRGWLLKLNAQALAGAYLAVPLSALDDNACDALRLYGHPRYAATAVISLASREPPSALERLNINDVQPDGSAVRVAGRVAEIPDGAQGILRAQLAFRLAEGANPTDPLFISVKPSAGERNGRGFGRTTAHGLHQRLTTVALETGLSVVAPEPCGQTDPKRRLRRQGLTVHQLPTLRTRQ